MNDDTVARPVDGQVRPTYLGDGREAFLSATVDTWPVENQSRFTKALYDQAALDAAVALERERCAQVVEGALCMCCFSDEERETAAFLADEIRGSNADVVRLDAAGGQSERTER